MTGFVYKWTNQVNGKWYIGSRKGTTDDGYRHSSKILAAAEKKYGQENFTREILFEGDYEKDKICSVVEAAHLQEEDAANNPMSYNQWNITGPNCCDQETRNKMSRAKKGKTYEEIYGSENAKIIKQKRSESRIGKFTGSENSFKGQKHSDKSRQLMSAAKKGKTWEEIYGPEEAAQMKYRQSQKMKNLHRLNREKNTII